MSQYGDDGLDIAALLVGVCAAILEDAIDNDGRDLNTGEYISQAAVDEVDEAIRLAMPTMSDHDSSMFATGICTGLAAAVRFLEAKQQDDDVGPVYGG